MKALAIYAGPAALAHLRAEGLRAGDVSTIPGAAGGPKGLVLGPIDRFIFGEWLPQSSQPVDLVGASIGAWRMATACLNNPVAGFERLERDYIAQHYEVKPGQKRPSAKQVSDAFGSSLQDFYGGRLNEVLNHPRYGLHIVTSRGRGMLQREHPVLTPLGYTGAFVTNLINRGAMSAWLERVVFSNRDHLPFVPMDYDTRQVPLTQSNFNPAVQASCSIPFVLQAVHDIPGAPRGAYWDGGITDYHLHLNYNTAFMQAQSGLVLYPHFQKAVVPGWLDKSLKWRHRATPFLDRMVLLAPKPEWVATLPNGKLPDRTDFTRYGNDLAARMKVWNAAVSASTQLADEFAQWLQQPDVSAVQAL
jgi:hypothetical protein